ncbi:MAG TPA: LacI family DNA-binding transcriptional regulator [Anaerohalosphaeraceae bacterium]|nr:LacI family DNA-binding transcriptional regulator [Phycisphaerae bacterium]HOL30722.1 LacI family DNA-binding transcriptional regulator [Anaerohalosphaeraceae bacterium]HOM75154.1 LacI family DNA-binding transcriptional regulator [Anaerohalosphaeraceae bacterium]HPC63463.1 LacI family DNA-binding transcriptional regulator [Anaerohalosphaeraceae bacterium]HPO70396.1 LacI family DNA-binding transcriptional regulator [Anaerohalosphaeraceae bacterium]
MKNGIPSLEDVARIAGVSKSTVSRILNNRLGNGFSVRDEVRQRVLDTVRKLNYRPNLFAKSLTMQSTRMIHIFGGNHALSDLGNIYQTVVNNITQVMESVSQDYDVTVDMSRHSTDVSEMPAWKIDGAVILAKCTSVTMDEIVQMRIPYVVVNGPCPEDGFSVVPDDIGGTKLAMQHLFELGHRRIAYSGPLPPFEAGTDAPEDYRSPIQFRNFGLEVDVLTCHSSLRDRYETYLSQMRQHGLEPITSAAEMPDTAEDYLHTIVYEKGATAVLVYGHMGALNLLQAAHSLHVAVPEQLSIICFCDEYANRVMSPRLTFIDLCSEKMGKTAAELLLEQIQHPEQASPVTIVLDEKLVIRSSTAPPRPVC